MWLSRRPSWPPRIGRLGRDMPWSLHFRPRTGFGSISKFPSILYSFSRRQEQVLALQALKEPISPLDPKAPAATFRFTDCLCPGPVSCRGNANRTLLKSDRGGVYENRRNLTPEQRKRKRSDSRLLGCPFRMLAVVRKVSRRRTAHASTVAIEPYISSSWVTSHSETVSSPDWK